MAYVLFSRWHGAFTSPAENPSKSLFFREEEAGPGIANVLITQLGVRYGGAEESAAIAHEYVARAFARSDFFNVYWRST
jgi:hypothetical protein